MVTSTIVKVPSVVIDVGFFDQAIDNALVKVKLLGAKKVLSSFIEVKYIFVVHQCFEPGEVIGQIGPDDHIQKS
jgi:hypothetical protein